VLKASVHSLFRIHSLGKLASSQVEKNEICEKLAKLSKEERENPAVIKGMTRSLEVALAADSSPSRTDQPHPAGYADSDHAIISTPVLEMVDMVYTSSVVIDKITIKQDELGGPAVVAGVKLTREALIQHDVDNGNIGVNVVSDDSAVQPISVPELVRICESEMVNVTSLSKDINDVTMDQDKVQLAEHSKGENITDFAVTTIGEHSIQPAVINKGVSEVDGESDGKGNDALIKFGIAAFGVVVGGVFLALQGGKPNIDSDEKGRTDEQKTASSTVQIEQLSDNGDDEWVSVPSSRSS
jgi:hypothetical protein